VIACAKADERPIRPGSATATALWRHLGHVTEELRRQRHADLLRARPETVRTAAVRLLESGLARGNACVLANEAGLHELNRAVKRPFTMENVLAPNHPAIIRAPSAAAATGRARSPGTGDTPATA
jgi:hypothetical protein